VISTHVLDTERGVPAAGVLVRLAGRDQDVAVEQLDANAARRNAAPGVENVRRDHGGIFHCGAAVDKKSRSRRSSHLRGRG
jgi:5-hydroxyisourate hydrolase-like protein (transthyretin family)